MRAIEQNSMFRGVNYDPEKQLKIHRERLKNTRKSIDNNPPASFDGRLSPRKQTTRETAKENVYRDNFMLARRIFDIMEGRSDLAKHINDTRHLDNHPGTMNFKQRFNEAQRIHVNNMFMASRLQTIKPFYKAADLTVFKPTRPKSVSADQSARKKKTKFMKELEYSLNILAQENPNLLNTQPQTYFKGFKFHSEKEKPAYRSNNQYNEYTEDEDEQAAGDYDDEYSPSGDHNNNKSSMIKSRNILLEYTKIQNNAVLDVVVVKEPFRDRYIIFGKDVDTDQRYELRLTSEDVTNILDGDILVTSVDNVEVWMTLLTKVLLQPVKEFTKIAYTQEELNYIELNQRHSGPNSARNSAPPRDTSSTSSKPSSNAQSTHRPPSSKISQGKTIQDIGFTDTMVPHAVIVATTSQNLQQQQQEEYEEDDDAMRMVPSQPGVANIYAEDGNMLHHMSSDGAKKLPIIITQDDYEILSASRSHTNTNTNTNTKHSRPASSSGVSQHPVGENNNNEPAEFSSPMPSATQSAAGARPMTAQSNGSNPLFSYHHQMSKEEEAGQQQQVLQQQHPTPPIVPPINLKAVNPHAPAAAAHSKGGGRPVPGAGNTNTKTNMKKPIPPIPATARNTVVSGGDAHMQHVQISQTARKAADGGGGIAAIPLPVKDPKKKIVNNYVTGTTTTTATAVTAPIAAAPMNSKGMAPTNKQPMPPKSSAPSAKRALPSTTNTTTTTATSTTTVPAPTSTTTGGGTATEKTDTKTSNVIVQDVVVDNTTTTTTTTTATNATNAAVDSNKDKEKITIIPPLSSTNTSMNMVGMSAISSKDQVKDTETTMDNMDGLDSSQPTPVVKPVAPGTKVNKPKQTGRPLRGSTFRPTNDTTTTTTTTTTVPVPPSTTNNGGSKTPRKPQGTTATTTTASTTAQPKKPVTNTGISGNTPIKTTTTTTGGGGAVDIAGAIAAAVAAVNKAENNNNHHPDPDQDNAVSRPTSSKKQPSLVVPTTITGTNANTGTAATTNTGKTTNTNTGNTTTSTTNTGTTTTPSTTATTTSATTVVGATRGSTDLVKNRSENTKLLQGVVESLVQDALTEAISHCTLTPLTPSASTGINTGINTSISASASAAVVVTHEQFLAKLLSTATEDSLDESNYYDGLFGDSTAAATSNNKGKSSGPVSPTISRPKSAARSMKSTEDKPALLNTSTISSGGDMDDLYEHIRSSTPTKSVKVSGAAGVSGVASPPSSKRGTRPQSAAKKTRSEEDYATEEFYEDDGGFEPI